MDLDLASLIDLADFTSRLRCHATAFKCQAVVSLFVAALRGFVWLALDSLIRCRLAYMLVALLSW